MKLAAFESAGVCVFAYCQLLVEAIMEGDVWEWHDDNPANAFVIAQNHPVHDVGPKRLVNGERKLDCTLEAEA